MLKKRLLTLFTFCLILCTFSLYCTASGVPAADFLEGRRGSASSERAEVGRVLEESAEQINQTIKSSSSFLGAKDNGNLSQTNPVGSFQMERAYPLYSLKDPNLVAAYRNSGSFADNISGEYTWNVPTSTGFLIRVRQNESGDWAEAGFSDEFQEKEGAENVSALTDQARLIRTIEESGRIPTVSDVRYVDARLYTSTTLIYIKADGAEYLIPYGPRPELTGLQNGKLYSAGEVVEILAATSPYDEVYSTLADVKYGGAGDSIATGNGLQTILWIAAAAILSAGILAAIWAIRTKIRQNKPVCPEKE